MDRSRLEFLTTATPAPASMHTAAMLTTRPGHRGAFASPVIVTSSPCVARQGHAARRRCSGRGTDTTTGERYASLHEEVASRRLVGYMAELSSRNVGAVRASHFGDAARTKASVVTSVGTSVNEPGNARSSESTRDWMRSGTRESRDVAHHGASCDARVAAMSSSAHDAEDFDTRDASALGGCLYLRASQHIDCCSR